ncbi:division/cell wall cluster transcriptional repressor MraZ [Fretibacter rubidus]|uniref:division/cell wall cluster transcriptional repressor MraZ n=1 Tax=Fretibacter rubidus TaxID=570162 RepID=UPI003529F6A8
MSTTTNNRDAKGRVSVPSDFRAVIAAQNAALIAAQPESVRLAGIEPFDGIIVRPSFDGQCLEGGGEVLFNAYRASINAIDYFDPKRDAMENALFGESRRLSFDSGGRVSIPQDLADNFGFNGRITFVGLGDRFEIWAPDAHEARVANMRKLVAENRHLLKPINPMGGTS